MSLGVGLQGKLRMSDEIDQNIDIGCATESDLEGILALQAENQPEYGGTLSASFPKNLFASIMRETPVIVAWRGSRVIGYLVTSTKKMNAEISIINAMLTAYSGATDAHVYGPICVKAEERGKGLAQAMFFELQRLEPTREYVLFIRSDNSASLRAHKKMGMRKVANFVFCENNFVVLSFFRPADEIAF